MFTYVFIFLSQMLVKLSTQKDKCSAVCFSEYNITQIFSRFPKLYSNLVPLSYSSTCAKFRLKISTPAHYRFEKVRFSLKLGIPF